MNPKISVIVPIYNVAKYLANCIDSLLNQTYSDIEIILVDDGSTDESGKICDKYEKNHKNIRVIHQKNSGLTVTRRNGVNFATGEYVGFVDGDDWVDADMYEALMRYVLDYDVDIVTSGGIREHNHPSIVEDGISEGRYEVNMEDLYFITHLFPVNCDGEKGINGAIWNKLFLKEVVKNVLNSMSDDIHGYMDDNVCTVGAILKSKSIYVSKVAKYHHREHDESFTYRIKEDGLMQVNAGYFGLKSIVEQSKYKSILMPAMQKFVSLMILDAWKNMFGACRVGIPEYYYKSEEKDTFVNVIIYGAGKVGKSYYRQFMAEKKFRIVGVVDQYEEPNEMFPEILRPEQICKLEYERVIIAVLNEKLAMSIKKSLMQYGVEELCIIWKKPMGIIDYYS